MPPKRAIGFEIKTLSNLIKRQVDQNISRHDIAQFTGMQGWIIGFLYHHQDTDMFQRDIEAKFQIRRSTATGVIQRMEKSGLILRESVSQDARLKKLVLTEKAIGFHHQLMSELDAMEEKLARGLTKQEIEDFFTIIGKMKKNIE